MEEQKQGKRAEIPSGTVQGTTVGGAAGIQFQWQKWGEGQRAVPLMAIAGKELHAAFSFTNATTRTISQLSIGISAVAGCECGILRCSDGPFSRREEGLSESRLFGLFRTTSGKYRIHYEGRPIGPQGSVSGTISVSLRGLKNLPVIPLDGVPVDFVNVAFSLAAEYVFNDDTTAVHETSLPATEIIIAQKGGILGRLRRKLRDEWVEYIAIVLFGWIMGQIIPAPTQALNSLWSLIIGLFR